MLWKLCHRWLHETHTLCLPAVDNTNVTVALNREMVLWCGSIPHDVLCMDITNTTAPYLNEGNITSSAMITVCTYLITSKCVCKAFHQTLYGCLAVGDYSKLTLFNFSYSEIPKWQMLAVVGWNDVLIFDTLCLHITVSVHIVDIGPDFYICAAVYLTKVFKHLYWFF